ncbi:MAG: PDZ domain-containing protein [Verrucomicrobiales bacterium]
MLRRTFTLFAILPCLLEAGQVIHVSPAGDDGNPGDASRPLRTPGAALVRSRDMDRSQPREILFESGIYHLETPLVFGPDDSGTEKSPLILRAKKEGEAVLSGGIVLNPTWTRNPDGSFSAPTPPGLHLDQLFADGKRLPLARYPNENPDDKTAAWQGFSPDAFSKERAARWADPAGGFIHAMHVARWGGYHYLITGKNDQGEVTYEGGWQNNRPMGMHAKYRMVENIREELDAPGEWFHDAKTNQLFLMPLPGMEPEKTAFVGVRLASLIEFKGTAGKPVRGITLSGFTLRHTARTFMETKEPLLRSDWTIHRGGAIFLEGTERITLGDLHLDQPGGNGIFASGYNRRTLVRGCLIENSGASAIAMVGKPEAVRNPLFQYDQTQDLLATDTETGPKSEDYPADMSIEDCLLRGIGRIERQSAGVQISMAARVAIRDTTIHDCSRAGINISEGTWGGHLIERVDVFDTVLETHDHGSFNSWGRDRFWHPNRNVTNKAVAERPQLPLLDAVETTIIRHSRWRCDHGWDIDLDDGSSNYEIHHNLMLAGGLKFREGFRRRAWNNIMINNGFHPHVWYANSGDIFEKNIVMTAPKPIGMPSGWESSMRSNFLVTNGDSVPASVSETGSAGFRGEAMFLDPAAGDFRVAETSPALKIGFENFPMDQFGVKKPALRAMAATPVIPPWKVIEPKAEIPAHQLVWRGARLVDLQDGQFSAFGTKSEDGGVALDDVPGNSAAAKAGLRKNDLIQGANDRKVKNLAEFSAVLLATAGRDVKLSIVRDQKAPIGVFAGKDTVAWTWKATAEASKSSPVRGLVVESHPKTQNEPLDTLLDGEAKENYGPVFGNGITKGVYRIAIPADSPRLTGINMVTHSQGGRRGPVALNVFTSNAEKAPGWDPAAYQPLGGLDGRKLESGSFNTLRAVFAQPMEARWLLIETHPVTASGEHTAFQEIAPIFEVKP